MRKILFMATIGIYSFFANAVWPPRPFEVCSTLLADPHAFVAQLSLKNNLEDFMAKRLSEVRRHPTFAALDPARLLIVKSADSSPAAIWVFPDKITAKQGLANGSNDDYGHPGNGIHKFLPPVQYQWSDLMKSNPQGQLVSLSGIRNAALFTSDNRTIRPDRDHEGFDLLNVFPRSYSSAQLIAAFGDHINRAEPALRQVYNRNYSYLLSELLLNDHLLEVLDPANVISVNKNGHPYFVFLGSIHCPLYSFQNSVIKWETLLANASTGQFVEVMTLWNSAQKLEITPNGTQKLRAFLARRSLRPGALKSLEALTQVPDMWPVYETYQWSEERTRDFFRALIEGGVEFNYEADYEN